MKAIKLVKFTALVGVLTILAAALAWGVYSYTMTYLTGLIVFGVIGIKEYRDSGKLRDVITVTVMVCLWWPMVLVGAILIIVIKQIEDLCKYTYNYWAHGQ